MQPETNAFKSTELNTLNFDLNLIPSTFSSILAAACEHKSVMLFDPLTRRLVSSIERAHEDCVNCVRFFDSRTFATCSDDCTVALWDSRLGRRLRICCMDDLLMIEIRGINDLLCISGT